MTQVIESYPNLMKACVELAFCNLMINREETEEEFLRSTDEVFGAEGVDHADLVKMDTFISTLTEEEVSTLVDGEHDDINVLIARAEAWNKGLGPKLNGLLNDVFDREPEGYRPGWV